MESLRPSEKIVDRTSGHCFLNEVRIKNNFAVDLNVC
jgi:hypothetical protein